MAEGDFRYVGDELDLFARASNWHAYLASQVRPFLGTSVLEVGAGIGSTTRALWVPTVDRWLGIEPDPVLFAQFCESLAAAGPAGVEARCATTADLGADERFDTALYIDVMEHIADDVAEMARLRPHLRPGAYVVVLAPAHRFLFTPFDAAIGHVRRYDRASMSRLTVPGLRLVSMRYLDSVGMLASLGNRLLLRSAKPRHWQITFWDRWLVPMSGRIDPMLRHAVGKSLLAIWQRSAEPA